MRQALQAMNDVVNNRDFGLIYWQGKWLCARRGVEDRVDREAVRRALNALNSRFDAVRPAAGP